MTITLSGEIRLPRGILRTAGFKTGDELEVKAMGGVVTLTHKAPVAGDDEYTPEERRAINAEITEAQKGPYFGPFKSAEEFAVFFEHVKTI